MTQNNWTVATNTFAQWTAAGDWSLNHVPMSTEDAFIGTNTGSAFVFSSSNETVNSIGTSSSDFLGINDGSTFTATHGTGSNQDDGIIDVEDANFIVGGTFDDLGKLEIVSNSSTPTRLELQGTVTINGGSSGQIIMGGSEPDENFIVTAGASSTLKLQGGLLHGVGLVGVTGGVASMTLDNVSSTITADVANNRLQLNTGANTITNDGYLEATNDGVLWLRSPVDNSNTITAAGGEVLVWAPVSGAGAINIGTGGTLDVVAADAGSGSIAGDVHFTGPGGTLILFDAGTVNGQVIGAVAGDVIEIVGDVSRVGVLGDHAVWQQTSANGGILSLYYHGQDQRDIAMQGQYTTLDFSVSAVSKGTSDITVQNPPTYAENPGNNDEWIMADGQWGASAGPGSHPAGYNVAGTGHWKGAGTDGILWYDPTTGDTDEWQLVDGQWAKSVDLGTHPANATDGASYQIAGTDGATDFTGNSIDDLLWTSPNSDGTIATDIWELDPKGSGKWAASVSPGSHPAGSTVAGTGDWTGSGTDGILWFNSSTGDTDEWQLNNGQWAASVDLGSHPGNAQIAGIGDFNDDGISDVLWTSINGDGTVAADIWELNSSGKWMASVSPGNHPAGYTVAGVGDFTGTGTSDILWYNASTGDADEWLIKNGQWSASIDLGTHPGGLQIAGIGDFNGDGTKDILWHTGP